MLSNNPVIPFLALRKLIEGAARITQQAGAAGNPHGCTMLLADVAYAVTPEGENQADHAYDMAQTIAKAFAGRTVTADGWRVSLESETYRVHAVRCH